MADTQYIDAFITNLKCSDEYQKIAVLTLKQDKILITKVDIKGL